MATSDSTSNSGTCSVYVIQAKSGAVKIGVARDVNLRLEGLQTSNHEELTIVFAFEFESREIARAVEMLMHKRYEAHALRGEWFSVDTSELLDEMKFVVAIARVMKSMSVETRHMHKIFTPSVAPKRIQPKAKPEAAATQQRSVMPQVKNTDEIYKDAVKLVQRQGWASVRLFKQNYVISRELACLLLDEMSLNGVCHYAEESGDYDKPRKVY